MTGTGIVAALGVVLGMMAAAESRAAGSRLVAAPLSWRMLATHNAERARWRVPAMRWDPSLAAAADAYAARLAASGRWGHSPRGSRRGQGENLWMGSRAYFSPEQMIGGWLSEGRYFHSGVFPRVSRTGNWSDVGHYSQVIWRGTTRVGCAIRSNRRNDYLVCRYSPHGNVDGRIVA